VPLAPRPADSRFARETETIRACDPLDLAATLAALSLIPANIDRNWRISALTTLASERVANDEKQPIDPGAFRALLTDGGLARHADLYEDPYENVLCEEVAYYEGPFLLSSGIGPESVYVNRMLTQALLLSEALPVEARGELNLLAGGVLKLSDHVLTEAGFERFAVPPHSPRGVVEVPGRASLRAAAANLVFEPEQLAALIAPIGLEHLRRLILDAGSRAFDEEGLGEGEGEAWPILRFGEKLVLARPLGLAMALNHCVLRRAVEEIGAEETAVAYSRWVVHDVLRSLRRMGIDASRVAEGEFIELRARIDDDVELLCLVISDDMRGLGSNPYAEVRNPPAVAVANKRVEEAAAETEGELFVLLVAQSSGRPFAFRLRKVEDENVIYAAIQASDLEAFAILEPRNPLALWKFARSMNSLERRGRVNSANVLDVFAAYREWERSLERVGANGMLTVPPGAGAELRVEARATRDRHPVPYVDGTLREVERDNSDPLISCLYGLSEPDEPRLVRYLPGLPLALWVAGPSGVEELERSWDLVETLAYWLDEIAPHFAKRLALLAERTPAVEVELEITDPDYWFGDGEDPGDEQVGEVTVEGLRARISLGAAMRRAAPAPDNGSDRMLVAIAIEALSDLFEAHGVEVIDTEERDAVREEVASLGLKKHFLAFPSGAGNEVLAPPAKEPRLIQEADITAVRDQLGGHLVEKFGHRGEAIPVAERRDVVREAVEFLLAEIGALLGSVSPQGLLERLLEANEGIVFEAEQRRAIGPARTATYPEAAQQQHLREEANRTNAAALCARFLVEHVAAQPPAGTKPWSTARYDRAMALCTVLVELAYLDDAYHYGMSEVGLLIDEDACHLRLAELDDYEQGRSRHFDELLSEQRRSSERIFMRRFNTEVGPSESELRERVDPLVEAEAGASLTDLRELLHAASQLARERGEDVVVLDREEAERRLAEMLEWGQARVSAAVHYLGMGPREKLLEPPEGDWHDVVPSRFSRRWSLLRRPFLLRDQELLWGRREVLAALFVIYGQFFSGRYQDLAQSNELRGELGRLAAEAGAKFEQQVGETFDAADRFEVKTNVAALGEEKLQRPNGETLGDIDVLAADTRARVLYAVECKDLVGALSPSEVAGELSEHFAHEGETAIKHGERVEWLLSRVGGALGELGVKGDADEWRVEGLFVTGRPVMGPYIAEVAFEIVAVESLPGWIDSLAGPPAKKRRRRRKKHGKRKGR
jgi:hypothetical protein